MGVKKKVKEVKINMVKKDVFPRSLQLAFERYANHNVFVRAGFANYCSKLPVDFRTVDEYISKSTQNILGFLSQYP